MGHFKFVVADGNMYINCYVAVHIFLYNLIVFFATEVHFAMKNVLYLMC